MSNNVVSLEFTKILTWKLKFKHKVNMHDILFRDANTEKSKFKCQQSFTWLNYSFFFKIKKWKVLAKSIKVFVVIFLKNVHTGLVDPLLTHCDEKVSRIVRGATVAFFRESAPEMVFQGPERIQSCMREQKESTLE